MSTATATAEADSAPGADAPSDAVKAAPGLLLGGVRAFGIFGYVMEKISIASSRNGEADIPAVLDRRDKSSDEGRSK